MKVGWYSSSSVDDVEAQFMCGKLLDPESMESGTEEEEQKSSKIETGGNVAVNASLRRPCKDGVMLEWGKTKKTSFQHVAICKSIRQKGRT